MPSQFLSALFTFAAVSQIGSAHPAWRQQGALQARSNPPMGVLPLDLANHPYKPQIDGQVRAPCPALNTLANHGYLPRDGKKLTKGLITTAMSDGWGIGQSVIDMALENAFQVCEIATGTVCTEFDLDVLAHPFAFEHDHSFSRQDFLMLWGADVNNFEFNRTIFANTLQYADGKNTTSIKRFDEMRLQRESNSYLIDGAANFHPAYFTQLTEAGFIFSVMRNFNVSRNGVPIQAPNNGDDHVIQNDWWMYWFTREEFPTALGWLKPAEDIQVDYVTSIRSSLFSASATSSPTPSAPGVASLLTTAPLSARAVAATPVTTGVDSTVTFTTQGLEKSTPTPTPTQAMISLPKYAAVVTLQDHEVSSISSAIASASVTSPAALVPYEVAYKASHFKSYSSSIAAYASAYTSAAEAVVTR